MNVKTWFVLVLAPLFCMAQDGPPLTLEQIMADQVWIGKIPSNISLSPDGRTLYFQIDQPIPQPPKHMMLDLADGGVAELDADHRPVAFAGNSYYHGKIRIDEVDGDLWLADDDNRASPLISRKEALTFVRFLGEEGFVYREAGQLFRYDLRSGASIQLTDIRFSDEDEDKPDYYSAAERNLFGYVDNLYKAEEMEEARSETMRELGPLVKPKAVYLGKGYGLSSAWSRMENRLKLDVSADGTYLAVPMAPEDDSGEPTDYAHFINKEGRLKALKARPRVATKEKSWKCAVVNLSDNSTHWIDFSDLPELKTDRLAAITSKLSEEEKALLGKEKGEDEPRSVEVVSSGFHGHHLLLNVFSRDYKDRWIVLVDVRTMEQTVVYHHYDPAWVQRVVRGLGMPQLTTNVAAWMEGDDHLYFLSDKTGYQHLYSYDVTKKKLKQLTKGNYEVFHPYLDAEGRNWFFHANRTHPGEYHLYTMPQAGGKPKPLTRETGFHRVTRSRDGKVLVDLFSQGNLPPRLDILRANGDWETLYDGRSEAFKAVDWMESEYVTYLNRDGKKVYARLYKPKQPNGAGVVFTHGAGYLQNAHKGWSGYSREYMFHNLLAQQGYTVLDPDYQASAGYGRDWRTAIYRHMGGKDLNDVIDGAGYLTEFHGVDAKRLGTYGGSYGGFLTFMALFTSPDTFQAGAALRPVSDWAHYNHWYTGRILNTPTTDPEAYRKSSPIYFAEGLKGRLLICHGMVDDNVQYIDVVRLSQRFIELGKKDWELAAYPVEPHGFVQPSSWLDEYGRIKKLFDETLLENN